MVRGDHLSKPPTRRTRWCFDHRRCDRRRRRNDGRRPRGSLRGGLAGREPKQAQRAQPNHAAGLGSQMARRINTLHRSQGNDEDWDDPISWTNAGAYLQPRSKSQRRRASRLALAYPSRATEPTGAVRTAPTARLCLRLILRTPDSTPPTPLLGWFAGTTRSSRSVARTASSSFRTCLRTTSSEKPATVASPFVTNVQGKILAYVWALILEDAVWLLGAPEGGQSLIAHLDRYLIREDVTLAEVTADWATHLGFGEEVESKWSALASLSEPLSHFAEGDVRWVRAPWLVGSAALAIAPAAQGAAFAESAEHAGFVVGPPEWEARLRVANLIPGLRARHRRTQSASGSGSRRASDQLSQGLLSRTRNRRKDRRVGPSPLVAAATAIANSETRLDAARKP